MVLVYFTDWYQHRKTCRLKQKERADRIAALPAAYHQPLTSADEGILDRPIQELVQDVHKKLISPIDILRAYGKVAIVAHRKTNCLTEVMISSAEQWAQTDGEINLQGPLAGIPVSLKDSVVVKGYDTSVGYSRNTGQPAAVDGTLAALLKQAGAIPYVKTNLPISLLSFESTNDLWGRCTNPHNAKYSPGGSTGGESALLALGGSRIGVGSDVAGSVRAPAHFSGCYSLRCSTGRWCKGGFKTSMSGQEGVASVFSPMARTMDDLTYFTKSFIGLELWKMDYTVHPIGWRADAFDEVRNAKKLRIGVLRTDGVVDPSPACKRAIDETVAALQKDGHDVFDVTPPSCYEALQIASILLNSDGCRTWRSHFRFTEWCDAGAAQMLFYFRLLRPVKYLWYLWTKYVRKDEMWAGLLRDWTEKSAFEQWKLVAKREAYRERWHMWWETATPNLGVERGSKMDLLLCPTNGLPATPHDAMHDAVSNCGYTFLFNLLDYTAGCVPVTKVDPVRDALPADFSLKKLNGIARGAYMHYDADAMAGLPITVQVVGQRLTEERVLAGMERVEDALDKWNGGRYGLLGPAVD